MGSSVGPLVMRTRFPARAWLRRSTSSTADAMSEFSASLPCPCSPQATTPSPGSITTAARLLSLAKASCVASWASMAGFIAGATNRGDSVASATVVSMSTASPCARRLMLLAVAGAMSTASAQRAQSMCAMRPCSGSSKASTRQGWVVSASKSAGATNLAALRVRQTRTSCPARMRSRARSAAR